MDIPDLPEMHQDLEPDYGKEEDKKAKDEVSLCRPRLLKWCRGVGLDLGCGTSKICKEAIGIDDRDRCVAQMAIDIANLQCFLNNSFDYIFSSHALEDIQNTSAALKEWLRVLRSGRYLVLYCPDKQYYFNIGHPLANVRHKHDYYWWDVAQIINEIMPTCKLIHYARYGPVYKMGEWSWELVVQK